MCSRQSRGVQLTLSIGVLALWCGCSAAPPTSSAFLGDWRESIGPGPEGGSVVTIQYGPPTGPVKIISTSNFPAGHRELAQTVSSRIAGPATCVRVTPLFQPSMPAEQFTDALETLGFKGLRLFQPADKMCHASLFDVRQLTFEDVNSSLRITGTAVADNNGACTITRVNVSGCQTSPETPTSSGTEAGNAPPGCKPVSAAAALAAHR